MFDILWKRGRKQATHFVRKVSLRGHFHPNYILVRGFPLTPKRKNGDRKNRKRTPMKEKIFVDLAELPRYEKGDKESYENREKLYQKNYQKSYRQHVKDIRIRVSDDEYQDIKKKAKKDGKPMTRYVLDHFKSSQNNELYKGSEMRHVLSEMGRIGTNINQMARALNSSRLKFANKKMKDDIETLREAVISLRKTILNPESKHA
mgnify:FL=1